MKNVNKTQRTDQVAATATARLATVSLAGLTATFRLLAASLTGLTPSFRLLSVSLAGSTPTFRLLRFFNAEVFFRLVPEPALQRKAFYIKASSTRSHKLAAGSRKQSKVFVS